MLPVLLPRAEIVRRAVRGRQVTVRSLCREAGIGCRVTGPAAGRKIYLRLSEPLGVTREPGPSGPVSIGMPGGSQRDRAILALGILAYVVFDYAARESMRGRPEARFSLPLGRPRKGRPLSGAERQRRWRRRREVSA